ncbi:hypothetical protein KIW84_023090 [Lathyrus oleraceus]|uniref:Aminotransferase-like plant mobile domain-containing protein n=1 Tax=Pisum sativum TaxID=3888 RepID=A0A9D4YEP6_PEA|nr:hypothetical protein KIW84_023090 [Pisum sativum]
MHAVLCSINNLLLFACTINELLIINIFSSNIYIAEYFLQIHIYKMYLLWMGESHRGTTTNIAEYEGTRFQVHSHTHIQPSVVIVPYLEQVGFAKVAKIASLKIDSKLVVALLERRRPKTHTFHLPTGEYTITLEDVSMLLGL